MHRLLCHAPLVSRPRCTEDTVYTASRKNAGICNVPPGGDETFDPAGTGRPWLTRRLDEINAEDEDLWREFRRLHPPLASKSPPAALVHEAAGARAARHVAAPAGKRDRELSAGVAATLPAPCQGRCAARRRVAVGAC